MSAARYFLPEHGKLTDVYSKSDLRAMLQAGELSRSDMVTDDETGIAYLLGDLLAMPFPDAAVQTVKSTTSLQPAIPRTHEFRADTPLPRPEHEAMEEEEDEEDGVEEQGQEEEEWDQDEDHNQQDEDRDARGEMSAARMNRADEEEQEQERQLEYQEEEVLLYVGHPSWLAFPKALFLTAVCIGSAVFFRQHHIGLEWITLLGSIAGLIVLFIGLDRTTTTYLVTTRRVEMEYGIIGRSSKEVRICDIRAIDVVQRGLGAVIGIGTVKFDSSASEGPEVCFRHVRRPHDIKQLVRQLQG